MTAPQWFEPVARRIAEVVDIQTSERLCEGCGDPVGDDGCFHDGHVLCSAANCISTCGQCRDAAEASWAEQMDWWRK